jgi:hypothetical protein
VNCLWILAASVTLAWDSVPDAALYRLYVGMQSMVAGNPPLVGYTVPVDDNTWTVDGLNYRQEYFFVVTAVNFDGLESGYSNEVEYEPRHGNQ